MTQTRAQARRFAAMQEISQTFLPESNRYMPLPGTTGEAVAKEIEELASLGRTERWKEAIAQWADMVRKADDPNLETPLGRDSYLQWAIVQGSTYANYASD